MAKVKLNLDKLSHQDVATLATNHKTALGSAPGNTIYTTPAPAAAVFDVKLAEYVGKLTEIGVAEGALEGLRGQRDLLREELEALLSSRARYVQDVSGGDEGKIGFSAFSTQSSGAPTTSLATPQNLKATMTEKTGEIKLTCKAVPKAKSYVWECREHMEGQVPGPWTAVKTTTVANLIATGLVTGKKYAFRVMVLGPNGTESAWSDEAVCMAP